jgi:hypothetical protein
MVSRIDGRLLPAPALPPGAAVAGEVDVVDCGGWLEVGDVWVLDVDGGLEDCCGLLTAALIDF